MKINLCLKSAAKTWMPALLVAAALPFSAAPVRAHNDDHGNSKDKPFGGTTLLKVFQDTYWRWYYGNITLPTDENGQAVLNGIALMPIPDVPGDGTPGQTNVTLRAEQPFFLPFFSLIGTSYTNGAPPDSFVDTEIFKTLSIKLTIDGKTVVERGNAMDFYTQFAFVPPVPVHADGIDSYIWFQSLGVLVEALSAGKHVLKLDVKNTKPLPARFGGPVLEYHNTFNLTVSPKVVPPTDRFKGKTYAQWSAKWWEWFLEYPADDPKHPHPLLDSNFDVRAFQHDDVWFLAGPGNASEITLTIPSNKALFISVATAEASSLEDPPFRGITAEEQRVNAKFFADHILNPTATIDGVSVGSLSAYRVVSPQFRFEAPTPWVFGTPPNFAGGRGTSVADGYYLLLEPLPKGQHTIRVTSTIHFDAGEVPEFGPDPVDAPSDFTYHLIVK